MLPVVVCSATACLGGGAATPASTIAAAPTGRLSIFVRTPSPASLGDRASGRIDLISRRYSLTCGPAGGTMPQPKVACAALANVRRQRPPLSGCIGVLGWPNSPTARVSGTYRGRPFRLEIAADYSWCGQSPAIMRDYWALSRFPCSTEVLHSGGSSPYALCRAVQAADVASSVR